MKLNEQGYNVDITPKNIEIHSFEYIKLGIKFRYHRFKLCYVLKNILFKRQKTTRKHRAWFKKSTNNAKN